MKIRLGELRRIIREAIDGPSDLAAYVIDGGSKKTAVIYSPSALIDYFPTIDGGDPPDAWWRGIVKGYMMIKKPTGPCNGAWEVAISAGPGMGKVVYSTGYAMSPNGILIPDRKTVSSRARGGWEKQGGRRKKPLDNIAHPPAGEDLFHDAHHTADTSDDCSVNPAAEHLNFSYEAEGWEHDMLASMMSAHLETMRWFEDNSGTPPAAVEKMLKVAGFEMSWSVV